jgi:hypothetical protein
MDARIDERALDEHLAALEAARPWSPRTISRLETLVRTGDDEAVFRVNPIKFAAERGMAEAEAIDLFLHATAVGLFAMDWLLLCPLCSCVVGSFGSLRAVDNHYHCSMCQTDYEAKLDDYIAVTFTVASTIRRIAFHAPAGLPARDYVVKYRVTGPHLAGRTPDGLIWGDLADQLTRVVSYLPPGETVQLEVIASGGFLLGYDTDSDAGFVIAIAGEATAELQTVRLDYLDGRCEPAGGKVRPGLVVIEITNTTTRRGLFAVAELPAHLRAVPYRGAAADHANVPRPVPGRGDPGDRGDRRQGHHAAVHRPQGLDGALRVDRGPQRPCLGAAALRAAA